MPPHKAPAPEETAPLARPSHSESTVETVAPIDLVTLLESLGVTDSSAVKAAANNDLGKLSDDAALSVADWYARRCGLNPQHVAVLKTKQGKVCYVKAAGVFEFARGKFKSIDCDPPTMFRDGVVIVFARVELVDGSSVRLFAARGLSGAESIMACETAAAVRALRVAVGIPIPSEGEVQ